MLLVFQEECNGKRSRNPSTSSSYGLRIGGYRSRRASEGDDGASSSSRGGARSRGSSRHSSGGQDRGIVSSPAPGTPLVMSPY